LPDIIGKPAFSRNYHKPKCGPVMSKSGGFYGVSVSGEGIAKVGKVNAFYRVIGTPIGSGFHRFI